MNPRYIITGTAAAVFGMGLAVAVESRRRKPGVQLAAGVQLAPAQHPAPPPPPPLAAPVMPGSTWTGDAYVPFDPLVSLPAPLPGPVLRAEQAALKAPPAVLRDGPGPGPGLWAGTDDGTDDLEPAPVAVLPTMRPRPVNDAKALAALAAAPLVVEAPPAGLDMTGWVEDTWRQLDPEVRAVLAAPAGTQAAKRAAQFRPLLSNGVQAYAVNDAQRLLGPVPGLVLPRPVPGGRTPGDTSPRLPFTPVNNAGGPGLFILPDEA